MGMRAELRALPTCSSGACRPAKPSRTRQDSMCSNYPDVSTCRNEVWGGHAVGRLGPARRLDGTVACNRPALVPCAGCTQGDLSMLMCTMMGKLPTEGL